MLGRQSLAGKGRLCPALALVLRVAALGIILLSRDNWECSGNCPSSSCLWQSPCTRCLEEDLVLTQPCLLCPALQLLSPAALAVPLTFPPFRAAIFGTSGFCNQLKQKQSGDEESRKWQLCVGVWIASKLIEGNKF